MPIFLHILLLLLLLLLLPEELSRPFQHVESGSLHFWVPTDIPQDILFYFFEIRFFNIVFVFIDFRFLANFNNLEQNVLE